MSKTTRRGDKLLPGLSRFSVPLLLNPQLPCAIICLIEQVHERARSIARALVLEGNVEIGCRPQHVEQRPNREFAALVGFEIELDLHLLDPAGSCCGRNGTEIFNPEEAPHLFVKFHLSGL